MDKRKDIKWEKEEKKEKYFPKTKDKKQKNKKKKKISKFKMILLYMLLGIIIVIGLSITYFIVRNSNEKIILAKSFEKIHSSITSNTRFDLNIPSMSEYLNQGEITIETDSNNSDFIDMFTLFENFKVNYDFERRIDSLFINADAVNNEESVIDLQFLAQDNYLYLFVQEIFQKPIEHYFKTDGLLDNSITIDDYKHLFSKILESFINNINTDDITNEICSIKIDDKDIRTNKQTILLGSNELNKLVSNILNDLRNDEQSNEFLNKLFNEILIPTFDENITYEYSVHTKGIFNIVVGIDLVVIEDLTGNEYYEEDERVISLKYRDEELDTYYFSIDDETYRITLEKTRNFYQIKVYNNRGRDFASLIYQGDGTDRLNIELILHINDHIYSFTLDSRIITVSSGREYKINSVLTLKYSGIGESGEVVFTINMLLKLIAGIDLEIEFDINEAVTIDNLTEEDLIEINANFYRVTQDNFLVEDIVNQTKCNESFNCNCHILPDECICNYMDDDGEIRTVNCPIR